MYLFFASKWASSQRESDQYSASSADRIPLGARRRRQAPTFAEEGRHDDVVGSAAVGVVRGGIAGCTEPSAASEAGGEIPSVKQ
jgi:hypothetical protein